MNTGYLDLQKCGDARGELIVAQTQKELPFAVRRVFWMYGVSPDAVRGQHANRRSAFVLACVRGACLVRVRDGRGQDEIFRLDRPDRGLYLPPMIWKDMYDFSPDAVLLCLSSEAYDAAEYIRDYDAYRKEVNS